MGTGAHDTGGGSAQQARGGLGAPVAALLGVYEHAGEAVGVADGEVLQDRFNMNRIVSDSQTVYIQRGHEHTRTGN